MYPNLTYLTKASEIDRWEWVKSPNLVNTQFKTLKKQLNRRDFLPKSYLRLWPSRWAQKRARFKHFEKQKTKKWRHKTCGPLVFWSQSEPGTGLQLIWHGGFDAGELTTGGCSFSLRAEFYQTELHSFCFLRKLSWHTQTLYDYIIMRCVHCHPRKRF